MRSPLSSTVPIIAAFLYFLPAAFFASVVGPELPTLGGALVGGGLFVALVKWKWPSGVASENRLATPLLRASLPYLIVLCIILTTRLLSPIEKVLRETKINWTFADIFTGSVALFYHPGTILMVALLAAAAISRSGIIVLKSSLVAAAVRLPSVALALVAVLLMARLMVHSGMISALALAAAETLGSYWALGSVLI